MLRFGIRSRFHQNASVLLQAYDLQKYQGVVKEGIWTETICRPGGSTWEAIEEQKGRIREDWVEVEMEFEDIIDLLGFLQLPLTISIESRPVSSKTPVPSGAFVPGTSVRTEWDGAPLPDFQIMIQDV